MRKRKLSKDREHKCIDSAAGENVYDYFNGALSAADVCKFEIHLISCPYCQSVILDLDLLLAALHDEQGSGSPGKAGNRSKGLRSPPFMRRYHN